MTATEVSSDNSALMRNIRRHENGLEEMNAAMATRVYVADPDGTVGSAW